ncbi:MAG TPA: hypothetical protein VGJ86_10535 [Acidimicrobiales bacterium]
MPQSVPIGDAQVLLRVWVEQHDSSLRGRLVLPPVDGPSTARGVDDLCALVRQALEQLQHDLAPD